jgi:hypothetical protein
MGCHLEDDQLFFILAGVARDRRDELGDEADLSADPVWVAALCFLGLEDWQDTPEPEQRVEPRGVIKSIASARTRNVIEE